MRPSGSGFKDSALRTLFKPVNKGKKVTDEVVNLIRKKTALG